MKDYLADAGIVSIYPNAVALKKKDGNAIMVVG
jgi:hypothetical protein